MDSRQIFRCQFSGRLELYNSAVWAIGISRGDSDILHCVTGAWEISRLKLVTSWIKQCSVFIHWK